MSDGIIGSVGVSVTPDATGFWRRFEADTRAGASEAGRRAGADWRREFDAAVGGQGGRGPAIRPEVDTTAASAEVEALRRRLAELSNAGRIDLNASATAAQLATIMAATNRLTDSQQRLTAAQTALREASRRAGVTEEELAAATNRVTRAERDQELAALRLAAAQQAAAAAAQRNTDRSAAQQAAAERAAARAAAQQAAAARAAERSAAAQEKQRASAGGLLQALLPLAPALVPVAGAAVAAGGALAAMGVSGVLALKGIQAEMKSGSSLGVQYAAQVKVASNALSTLEKTAAKNFLGGFQGAVSKLNQSLPGFNNTVGSSSKILGDIASHLAGGLSAGFTTFQPVILSVERGIDSLAARFEKFASSESGSKFASTLVDDFKQVGQFISSAASAITHLIVAAAPVGSVLVGAFRDLADAINAIPVPVLTAAITALSAFGTARLIGGLAPMLARVGTEGAAAGAGIGRVAAGLSRVVPYVAAAVGLHIAFDTAAASTSKWATSSNDLQYATFQTSRALKDLFSLNLKAFGSDLVGKRASDADKYRAHVLALASSLKVLEQNQSSYQRVSVNGSTVSLGSSNGQFDINSVAIKNSTATATAATHTYYAAIAGLIRVQGQFNAEIGKVPLSQASGQYLDVASSIDKSNESLGKFLNSGKDLGQTYDGVKIRATAYDAALVKTNGDAAKALGIVQGQIDAYNVSAAAAANYAAESQRLSQITGAAAAKYKLTTDQVDLYSAVLGVNIDKLASGEISQHAYMVAIGGVAHAAASAGVSFSGYLAAVATFNTSTKTAADKAALLGSALHAMVGDTLSTTNLNLQAASAAEGVANAFAKYSGAVSKNGNILGQATKTAHGYVVLQPKLTEGGLAIASALQQQSDSAIAAASALYQSEVRTKGQAAATKDATGLYMGYREQLKSTLTQMTGNADAAQHLTDKYLGLPKNVKTFAKLFGKGDIDTAIAGLTRTLGHFSHIIATAVAKLNRDDVNTGYDDVVSKINGLNGRAVNIPVKYTPVSGTGGVVTNPGGSTLIVGGHVAAGSRAAFGRQDGKVPPNTVATVGEGASHTWEGLVTDAHGRATIYSNSQAKAMGFRAPIGYASGSSYTPPSLQTTGSGSGSGSGSSSSSSGSSGGGKSNLTYIVDGHRYSTLKAAQNAATAAFKANVKLGVTIEKQGFSSWKSALAGTVSQAKAAFNTILSEAKKLGISGKLAASLTRENKKLDDLVAARNKVADKLGTPPAAPTAYDKLTTALQNLAQEASTVKAAINGSFDVTTAGANPVSGKISAGEIGAQSKQARTRIKDFYNGILHLSNQHLNKTYLQQLAEKGPDALPEVQALLGQKKIIAQLNRDQKVDNSYGAQLGARIGSKVFGSDVNAAQNQVNDLKARLHTDNVNIGKKLDHLEGRIANAVDRLADRPVQVVAPSGKVLWEYVRQGQKAAAR